MIDRSCGECHACCVVLRIEDLNKEMYVPCSNIVTDGCGSCSIYNTRPEVCRSFRCMWLDNREFFPDDFRPDKIGVMFYGELNKESKKVIVAAEFESGAINKSRVQEKINKLVKNFSIDLIRKDAFTKKKLPLAEEN